MTLTENDETPRDFLPLTGKDQRTLEEILSEIIVLVEQSKITRNAAETAVNASLEAIARIPRLERKINRVTIVQQWLPVAIVVAATIVQLLVK